MIADVPNAGLAMPIGVRRDGCQRHHPILSRARTRRTVVPDLTSEATCFTLASWDTKVYVPNPYCGVDSPAPMPLTELDHQPSPAPTNSLGLP